MTTNDIFVSLEQATKMQDLEQQALQSLQVLEDGQSAKCQKCGAIVRREVKKNQLPEPIARGSRVETLTYRLGWLQRNTPNSAEIKTTKEELEDLQHKDAKRAHIRGLPLFQGFITRYQFVCINCYAHCYRYNKRRYKKIKTKVLDENGKTKEKEVLQLSF
jgi:hypothetical protein